MSYDLDAIKAGLPEYLRHIGARIFKENESQIIAACPIHGGEKGNFHAKLHHPGGWVYICRSGCGGDGGTTLDLHAALNGLSPRSRENIKGVAEVLRIPERENLFSPMTREQRRSTFIKRELRRKEDQRREEIKKVTGNLSQNRSKILAPFLSSSWKVDFWEDSPTRLDSPDEDDARLFIRALFDPDDLLWLGDQFDSGEPHHAANFRKASQWLTGAKLPPRIASGTFKPASFSRSDSNLITSPFIVIESDDLIGHKPTTDEERTENKKLSAALIRLCRDRLKLTLRAVIDTGGKSLHGWFDRPSDEALKSLLSIAEGLAIDTAVITRASNPLRLPGCVHQTTGQAARLHFLNSKNF